MKQWRKDYVTALAVKDADTLRKLFTDNPQYPCNIALSTDEISTIADTWSQHISDPIKRNDYAADLINQMPTTAFVVMRAYDAALARAFLDAAKADDVFVVNPNDNCSPLHWAATGDDHTLALELTKSILNKLNQLPYAQQVIPELLNSPISPAPIPAAQAKPLLYRVCFSGNFELVNCLIDAGAVVDSTPGCASPVVAVVRNAGKHKTDQAIIDAMTYLYKKGFSKYLSHMDASSHSPLHTAVERYVQGNVGRKVLYFILMNGGLILLKVPDKQGIIPLDNLRSKNKLYQFEHDMRTEKPLLFAEYCLHLERFSEASQTLFACLKQDLQGTCQHLKLMLTFDSYGDFGYFQRQALLQQLLKIILTTDLLNDDPFESDAFNVALSTTPPGSPSKSSSSRGSEPATPSDSDDDAQVPNQHTALKAELVSAIFTSEPRYYLKRQQEHDLKVASEQATAIAVNMQNRVYPANELPAFQAELATAISRRDALLAEAKRAKCNDMVMLLFTMPYTFENSRMFQYAFDYLLTGRDEPSRSTLTEYYEAHKEDFSTLLLEKFNYFIQVRYGTITLNNAQVVITEINRLRERNVFLAPFRPVLALLFAQSVNDNVLAKPPLIPAKEFERLRIVFDAACEAGEIEGARELMLTTAKLLREHPLCDARLKRQIQQSLGGSPKAVVVPVSLVNALGIHQSSPPKVASALQGMSACVAAGTGSATSHRSDSPAQTTVARRLFP